MKTNLTILLLFLILPMFAADMWEQKANFAGAGRHRAAAFSIGQKGYLGFGHVNAIINIDYADFWEYDPATDSWTQKADFGGGKRYHNLVFSVGNKGYAGLGRDASGTTPNDMWEYDPITNIWTQLNDYPGTGRTGPVAFVINDVAYAGLGVGDIGGFDNSLFRYDPSNDSWATMANFPGNARNTGVAFAIESKGYVGTGDGSFGTGNDFWEYKANLDEWIQRANVGPIFREGATGFAVNNRGYILTGNNWVDNYNDVLEFNPGSNTWKQIENFPGSKRRFMVSFVIGNYAYCGTGTTGTNFNDFWRFDPMGDTKGPPQRKYIDVNVFPNPTTELINFEIALETLIEHPQLTLTILDIAGRVINQTPFTDTNVRYERNNLQNGVYCYQIADSEEVLETGKFIFH